MKFFALLVVVGLAIAGTLALFRRLRGGGPAPDGPSGVPASEWRHFMNICRGDEELALRLVAREKKKKPGIDERTAVRRAIKSWLADNR